MTHLRYRITLFVAGLVSMVAMLAACIVSPAEHVRATGQAITACTTIQRPSPGTGVVADAYVQSASPGATAGGSGSLSAYNGTAGIFHALVQWDVSSIPAGATVVSADAGFWVNVRNGTPVPRVHENAAAWVESTVTWATAPSYGAAFTGAFPTSGNNTAITYPLPVATVQGWLTGPNYGLTIETDAALGQETLATSETTTVARRPSLTVCYTTNSGPSCSDLAKNGAETDVDCGGGTCAGCAAGKACSVTTDCAGPLSCVSGVCGLLADGAACSTANQCQHGICGAGLCRPLGGESVTVMTSCARAPDTTINPTHYSYGSDPAQAIDVYTPPGTPPAGGWPVVAMIHGGGFLPGTALESCPGADPYAPSGCVMCGGSPNPCASVDPATLVTVPGRAVVVYPFACRVYANPVNGPPVACISIDYRGMSGNYPGTVNPYPAGANDAIAAFDYLVSNASTLAINPVRIGVWGFSAGAHLAGKLAEVRPVKRLALWYGNLYLDTPAEWSAYNPSGYNYLGCATGSAPCVATNAPAVNLHPVWGQAPVLLSHGTSDTTNAIAMSRRYRDAARAAGVDATLIEDAAGHGYGPTFGGPVLDSTCTAEFVHFAPPLL